ncbi:hypothetical protein [Planotetraspora kaengkrachanensis]|uniref:Uncharacterized protein n=1 Tax=Planotetraspora kaengkrachanensis TaxID=575193 RepID=A0A8J3PU14_9ACTN|nr:hypothetical protein [Planotetraspora kaengkrachanensis]GIG81034.1 hypothetical protein Pka01_41610 [Planotetraspora kaengkrachanensis]
METTVHATTAATHSRTERGFGTVKTLVAVYGALSFAVLIVDVVLSVAGRELTSFMWGRTGGMLASAVVTYWLTGLAARGSRSAFLRVRIISVVAPIAIIAIDLIPGALPPWFVAMQIAGALVLAPTAFIVNGSSLRGAFPKVR